MPTVLLSACIVFTSTAMNPNESPHFHVDRDDLSAKFWLEPVGLARNLGFTPKELRRLQKLVIQYQDTIMESWNGIKAMKADERVSDVQFTKDKMSVALGDGRTITLPLAWYPRLFNASTAERKNWRVAGGGYGMHWPDIDEDLSAKGLFRGEPAP